MPQNEEKLLLNLLQSSIPDTVETHYNAVLGVYRSDLRFIWIDRCNAVFPPPPPPSSHIMNIAYQKILIGREIVPPPPPPPPNFGSHRTPAL